MGAPAQTPFNNTYLLPTKVKQRLFGSVTGSLPRSGLLIVSRVIGNR
jgi:hypothetical protein